MIYRSVRKDLFPWQPFLLGKYSIVEDYSTLANAVGSIIIGDRTRVGMGNTIIGPVSIGNDVNLAQNIVVSGLNHNYTDISQTIRAQGVSTSEIRIENDVWIGANSVILAGVTIGQHSVIGAGSIVTRNIPPFSVAIGNPAKVIRHYDSTIGDWVKT